MLNYGKELVNAWIPAVWGVRQSPFLSAGFKNEYGSRDELASHAVVDVKARTAW